LALVEEEGKETTMTKVKLELTILQANCLAQLAEEADIETFASSGYPPARAGKMIDAGMEAIDILRISTIRAEKLRKPRKRGLSKIP